MKDYKNFIEFYKGSYPLAISVPHGGSIECETIPKRLNGIQGTDKGTIELTQDLIAHITEISKSTLSIVKKPSYIFSHVRRSKIDLNRKESEAYISNSLLGKEIYQFYHKKLRELITDNVRDQDYSLLLDIHGFEKNNRPSGYRDVELILGTNNLESFYPKLVKRKEWEKNLRGKIIKRFIELGIPLAPGHPRRKEYVLSGGFITRQYGASKFPRSQAMQIEFSDRIRLYDKELRSVVLRTLAEIINQVIMQK